MQVAPCNVTDTRFVVTIIVLWYVDWRVWPFVGGYMILCTTRAKRDKSIHCTYANTLFIVYSFVNKMHLLTALLWAFVWPTVRAYDYDWDRLHRCMAPDELRDTVEDYKENFPCLDCRDHWVMLMSQHPFPLHHVRTSEDVRVWTWLTHNLVNERLNKTWQSFDIMLECETLDSTPRGL